MSFRLNPESRSSLVEACTQRFHRMDECGLAQLPHRSICAWPRRNDESARPHRSCLADTRVLESRDPSGSTASAARSTDLHGVAWSSLGLRLCKACDDCRPRSYDDPEPAFRLVLRGQLIGESVLADSSRAPELRVACNLATAGPWQACHRTHRRRSSPTLASGRRGPADGQARPSIP